jgi:hypothetical protein
MDFFATSKEDSGKFAQTKFIKVDLNGDGLTDLLVNGSYLFAMVDDGKDNFKAAFIDRGTFTLRKYSLIEIDSTGRQSKVIVQILNRKFGAEENPGIHSQRDTLVLKYDGFVEYNGNPGEDNIKRISISTSGCFGTCPIFEMVVASSGDASYNARQYNEEKGDFKCEMDKGALSNLFNLANYINFKLLKDRYAVNWTDDQTATLKITFRDGTSKNISDYGLIGTFGLERLYDTLFALRKSQEWE